MTRPTQRWLFKESDENNTADVVAGFREEPRSLPRVLYRTVMTILSFAECIGIFTSLFDEAVDFVSPHSGFLSDMSCCLLALLGILTGCWYTPSVVRPTDH